MSNKSLVVITGASAGIGRALAQAFAKEGHPLLLISRKIEPLEELKNMEVMYAQLDVVDYTQFELAVRKAEKEYGKTECMINNAGLASLADFKEMPIDKCNYQIDVLIKGVLNGLKIALPDMSQRKSGTIINISSIADRKPGQSSVVYAASKHAVRSMAESLQMVEAQNNVRIINVAPGPVKTNIHKQMGISFEEFSERLGNPTFTEPKELAEIILFCFKQPQHICIRDIAIMPTDCGY